MPLEISEDLVSLAYQSLGYFIIEGRKVGVREVDLLAIRLADTGEVAERLHVEIQIGVKPIGVLRRKGRLENSAKTPEGSAREWVQKKFMHPHVTTEIDRVFCGEPYSRVLVHGALKDTSQLSVLHEEGVSTISLGALVLKAYERGAKNRLHRAVGIAFLLAE